MMVEGVSMSEVRARCELKLSIVVVGAIGVKLGEAVRSVGRRTH